MYSDVCEVEILFLPYQFCPMYTVAQCTPKNTQLVNAL